MRTERRHELHTNILAGWLSVQIERLRPYSRLAMAVVLGLLVLVGVWIYIQSQTKVKQDQQWAEYYQAVEGVRFLNKPEQMVTLLQSSDFERTPAGYWGAIAMGDYYLREGLNQLFSNRTAGKESLRSALQAYAQVTQQTKYPMLSQRALLEIGAAHEGLNELDEARKSYETILSTWPGSSFEAVTKQRIAELDGNATKNFYDWFFVLSPASGGILGPGTPGLRPGLGDLPTEGSFLPPKADTPPAGVTPEAGLPPIEPPASTTPVTEPPADATPPAEPPAAAGAPAAEPPAAAAPAAEPPKTDEAPKN